MVDGGLWAEGKVDCVGAMPEVVVEKRVSAGTLGGDGLPNASAAVPEELVNSTRVCLQDAGLIFDPR